MKPIAHSFLLLVGDANGAPSLFNNRTSSSTNNSMVDQLLMQFAGALLNCLFKVSMSTSCVLDSPTVTVDQGVSPYVYRKVD